MLPYIIYFSKLPYEPRLSKLIPYHPSATSEVGYFRFHGRNTHWFNSPSAKRYNYLYSEEELKSFLPSIKMIASKTQKVLICLTTVMEVRQLKTP